MIYTEYTDIYREYAEKLKATGTKGLNALRDKALRAFENSLCGDLSEPYKTNYGLNLNRVRLDGDPYKLFTCDIPNIGAYTYYIVNDTFYNNSSQAVLPEGVVVCPLSEAVEKYPELCEEYVGKLVSVDDNADRALNALFAVDGMFVYVPKGVIMPKPIQLVNFMYGNQDVMAISHNVFIISDDAKAQVLVCDHCASGQKWLSNRVTEVFVGKNAVYDHYKVESTGDGMTNRSSLLIDEKEGSEVVSNIITLTAGDTVNKINCSLSEPHSTISLCGICLADERQKVENSSVILHKMPDTESFESFKYILDGEAEGKFYGMIKVLPDAQKSVAMQTNKNICLSDNAQMRTMPQLEIYADDVKCNHGSTVGQLDDNALFYMLSRGLSMADAKMLLMSAFVHDVIEKLRIESFKDKVKFLVERRLRKEPTKCSTCHSCIK